MPNNRKNLDEPIIFSVAAEVESPNWTSRLALTHHRAISARVRSAVALVVKDIPPPSWQEYSVLILRVGANILDDDNLSSACKPARDEIASWLGYDDSRRSPISWSYDQRQERIPDPNPKAKRTFRTWLEVTVSPSRATPPALVRAQPPARLERERTKAPIRADLDRGIPIRDIELAPRINGTRVRVSLMSDIHGQRIRVCTAYMQQGHMWRTTGVALERGEVGALIDALGSLLAEGAGVIFTGAETGGGPDTPADDVKNIPDRVGKGGESSIPAPVPHPDAVARAGLIPGVRPRPAEKGKRYQEKHLNPKPPPLPKPKRPPPWGCYPDGTRPPPTAPRLDCNATAEDADNGRDE